MKSSKSTFWNGDMSYGADVMLRASRPAMYDSSSYDGSGRLGSLRERDGKVVAIGGAAGVYGETYCPWTLIWKSARRGVRSMSISEIGATSELAASERKGAMGA